ncbi:MAG: hypothetical protein GY844_33710 [Bradyrhizobium sp.]|nr:hypothetical protein [Bradyrhizobium sp.]
MQARTFGTWASFFTSVGAGALTQSPDYQFLALPIALLSGALFLILSGMFLHSNRREIVRIAKLIEPSHVIVFGLVVALGGVIWQWSRTPPSDPHISTLQGEISELRAKLAAAAETSSKPGIIVAAVGSTAPAASTPPIKPSKNYFPAEKKDLGDLYASILNKLNRDGTTAAKEAYNFGADTPAGNKHQLESYIDRVAAARSLVSGIYKFIYLDVLPNNPNFNFELTQLFSNSADNVPVGPFNRELEKYHRDLTVFASRFDGLSSEDRTIHADLLKRTTPRLLETSQLFQNWIQQCNERIDAQRELLR